MMNSRFLTINGSFDLSKRQIPILSFQAQEQGAVLWITAGCHGDEVIPVEIIHQMIEILNRISLRRGTVHLIPSMNPMSAEMIQRNNPQDNENLNRSYPGDALGSPTERLARLIFDTIVESKPSLVIDLHTMSSRSIPFIILDRFTQGEKNEQLAEHLYRLAEVFDTRLVYDFPIAEYQKQKLDKSLPGALLNHAFVPAYTVELGPKRIVDERFVQHGVRGILRTMAHLQMIDEDIVPVQDEGNFEKLPLDEKVWRRGNEVFCNQSGFVKFLVMAGQLVQKGEPLAQIKTILGEVIETINAPEDGFVISLVDRSIVFSGIEIVTLGVEDK